MQHEVSRASHNWLFKLGARGVHSNSVEMFNVAVLGHSLSPSELHVEGCSISVFRKTGGKWVDLESREFSEFWEKEYDLAIFIFGGNDLVSASSETVLNRALGYIERAKAKCKTIRVCSVEKRNYASNNRFGVVSRWYNRQRNHYNQKLKRNLRRVNVGVIDIGVPWLNNERSGDGVHYNTVGQTNFTRMLSRVIRGVKGSSEV